MTRFVNPANGYSEDIGTPGLWAFLFGIFWFMARGLWKHVAIQALAIVLGAVMGGPGLLGLFVMWLLYSFAANGILCDAYMSRGWVHEEQWKAMQAQGQAATPPAHRVALEIDTKTCPLCAETIKAAAIRCKHCGADLSEHGPATA